MFRVLYLNNGRGSITQRERSVYELRVHELRKKTLFIGVRSDKKHNGVLDDNKEVLYERYLNFLLH